MTTTDTVAPLPEPVTPLALRILRSPVGRIVAFAVLAAAIGFTVNRVWLALGLPHGQIAFGDTTFLLEASRLLPVVLAYWLVVRAIENRRMDELAPRKFVPHVLVGLLGGFALFSLVVGALWALGAYTVAGTNADVPWKGLVLVLGVGAGVGEEIISRGVLFRIVEEGLGTWISLLLSAAFFGFMHIWNPHATAWSAMAIALEAGLLFGLIYNVTRSLWICMGVHAAWNVAQGPFYGIPVSGFELKGWLASRLQGPDWLTGGEFGAEASVVALCICSTLTAVLLAVAIRRGTLVAPFWRRRAIKAG
ncbi:CPBP family intramembrane metalloprotease [Bacillus sp. NP157]|nr:CPBP family intramembrane metalloprotease [Bacillus sp. NP157]